MQGYLDLCVCMIDKKPEIENAIFLTKYEEYLLPVSSKKISLPLKKTPFLLYNKASFTRRFIDEEFNKHNIIPIVAVSSSSTTFLKELAILGRGVSLLPENFVSAEIKNKQLTIQDYPIVFKREVGIFLSKKTDLTISSDLVRLIIDCLKTK